MKRTQLHLTEQQIAKLKELSECTGMSVAEHVRRAIDRYFNDFEWVKAQTPLSKFKHPINPLFKPVDGSGRFL